ncbi:MAG: hypothetical protein AB7I48_21580 [Planctomycetaceae bacterium]
MRFEPCCRAPADPVSPPSSPRRLEVDREDLLREATALRQRAEYRVPGELHSVVAGYRNDGALSVYFGPDPCFYFDAEGRLRRAFVGGDLFRTQGGTLARLRRVRTAAAVELQRQDLSPDECAAFLNTVRCRLMVLADALASGNAECLGDLPGDVPLEDRLSIDLSRMLSDPLTLAPAVAGKK